MVKVNAENINMRIVAPALQDVRTKKTNYPFDVDEMISVAEAATGKVLTDYQKKMFKINIDLINFTVEFNDEECVSLIPLLDFDPNKIKCKYPNLYAEYIATGYHIDNLSASACVTKELMKAVLKGEEKLMRSELRHLYYLFFETSYTKYKYSYISSPKLSLVIPSTNKTIYRMKLLRDAVSTVDRLNADKTLRHYEREQLDQAREVINQVCNQRKAVPIAFYRSALEDMQLQISLLTPKPRRELNKDMAV